MLKRRGNPEARWNRGFAHAKIVRAKIRLRRIFARTIFILFTTINQRQEYGK